MSVMYFESYHHGGADRGAQRGTTVESRRPHSFQRQPLLLSEQSNSQSVYCQILVALTSNVSACDWVCRLWKLDAGRTTDSSNFAQGQRRGLILGGKPSVTCVRRGNASWQCDLPPICFGEPPENKPLHIIYNWQHCNTAERLGTETLHNLL